MSESENKGKTLWEMFTERLKGGGNGEGISFLNPLDLRVDSAVAVPPFHSMRRSAPMTTAVDASPNEMRMGLLWGIFIFVTLVRTSRNRRIRLLLKDD